MRETWSRRWRWLVRRLAQPYPTDHTTSEQRRGMRHLWLSEILGSASAAFYGEFVVLYMLALGASAAVVGIRASINSAASLAAPLLGAWLVARSGRRKPWIQLGPGGVARLTLLLGAAIPLVASGDAAVWLFVTLFALQAFFGALGVPAHNSLLGDVVPLPVRGRFLGTTMMCNNIVAVLVLPLAGWLVARVGGLQGYQLVWLLAAVVGFGATALYRGVPEPENAEVRQASAPVPGGGWRDLLGDRAFLAFCGIHFVWTFGIQLAGPFFSVHMVENLGFTADTIAYLATVTTLFNVVALRLAGEMVDRYGAPRMVALSMLLVPIMPIMWVFARTPFHVGVAKVYGFFAWSGFHVASLPLVLMMAPDARRAQYMAVLNTVAGVASVLAPAVAVWLYTNVGFTSNLLLSAGGRLLAGLLFVWTLRSGLLLGRREELVGAMVGVLRAWVPDRGKRE